MDPLAGSLGDGNLRGALLKRLYTVVDAPVWTRTGCGTG